MLVDLENIKTETRNSKTKDIDVLETKDILKLINDEDKTVAYAVEKCIPEITKLTEEVASSIANGGRLIYMGAGTSGRVGVIDAVECYPTFGVSHDEVMCLMAGGEKAFVRAAEGAEDDEELAIQNLKEINLTYKDIVVGIAASGRTPYVVSGCKYAKKIGAKTGCIVTSPYSPLSEIVDYKIEAITGAEVITGSTRMKSGTAQKMICNMISTAAMIKLGHVYQNLMIDVVPTNKKLVSRSINIIKEITGVTEDVALAYYNKYQNVKNSLFAILSGIDDDIDNDSYIEKVNEIMNKNNKNLRKALESIKNLD